MKPEPNYLRVSGSAQRTRYQLVTSATAINTAPTDPAPLNTAPLNTAPSIATNAGATLLKGTVATFNSNLLKSTDAEQSGAQLVYTLTASPENGNLLLNGTVLSSGGTFTQADVDATRLTYKSFPGASQLTNNATNDYSPAISGSNIVWYGIDGTDSEIYFYNGSTTTNLTNNTTNDSFPAISGSNVVWQGNDGTDSEIYFYNGSTTTKLTNNTTDDYSLAISGSNVVWHGNDSTDSEIYYSNIARSDRFNFTVTDGAGGSTAGTFNLTLTT